MSDRRAVSAGHLGASSVAFANETWRVAVGGNRVENMTVDQIAHAFRSGHLNARTPLWPPGTTGWQALGNFEQFQSNQYQNNPGDYYASQAGAQAGLSQFEEADDDPTRMWTGGPDELPGLDPRAMEAMQAQQSRPSARTGTRQVAPRPPVPSQPLPSQAAYAPPPPPPHQSSARPAPMPSRPVPVASQPVPSYPSPTASVASRTPALVPASVPPFRQSRGNGLMLVAGLVGLVGLGSAVLAARGSWGQAEQAPANTEVAQAQAEAQGRPPAEAAPAEPVLADPAPQPAATAEARAPMKAGEAQLAKYDDATPSAFVAGETAKAAASPNANEAANDAKPAAAQGDAADDDGKAEASKKDDAEAGEAAPRAEKAVKASAKARREEAPTRKVAARAAPRRTVEPAPRQKPAPAPRAEKVEKVEKAEKAVASEPQQPQPPANAAVNEAAAAALASSANLASSCRPRGGPAGPGKARVIYSNDGEVQSVEILTAKFRDTLTGSCVRMVFRRAKIPAFKGEPPTFIKSFTIPEE